MAKIIAGQLKPLGQSPADLSIDPRSALGQSNARAAMLEEGAARQNQSNAINRLRQIRQLQQQYPGRAPGGTGLTGLVSNDAKGWSSVLNEQSEAQVLENELQGKAAPTVIAKPVAPLLGVDNIADDPEWWLGANMNREPEYDANGQVNVSNAKKNAMALPANLRGLYAAGLKPQPQKAKK